MQITYLVIGLAVGVVIGFLIAKLVQKPIVNKEKETFLEKNVTDLKNELEIIRNKYTDAVSQAASKDMQIKTIDNQILELKKLKEEFKIAADSVLREAGKDITDAGGKKLEDILKPLQASIGQFQQKVEIEGKERATLKGEINKLFMLNQQMNTEAKNLTNALKGNVTTRGKWGEIILETILQKSGLEEGREYSKQETHKNEDGGRPRPDIVFNMPGDKHIILDSKVVLSDYESFCSNEDTTAQKECLKNYLSALRERVKDLSSKEYTKLEGLATPDFVIMFIPIEGAFSVAMQFDKDLVLDAYDKNVLILSPSLLIATLRIIYNIWQLEKQNKNVAEIARQAGALYDKFVGFLDDLTGIGNKIKNTQDTYEAAMKKIKEGKGNLIDRVEKIKLLGAKTTKAIPEELLDDQEEDNNAPF